MEPKTTNSSEEMLPFFSLEMQPNLQREEGFEDLQTVTLQRRKTEGTTCRT